MDYNIKYLKYKNKYINLKNMIGNGDDAKSPEELKQTKKLIKAGISASHAKSFISLSNSMTNSVLDANLFIDKAIKLMKSLTGINDKNDRANLIRRILKKGLTDEQITILNNNLFQFSYYININKEESFDILLQFTPIKFNLLKKIIDSKKSKEHYLYSFDRIIEIINDKIISSNLNNIEITDIIKNIDIILEEEKKKKKNRTKKKAMHIGKDLTRFS